MQVSAVEAHAQRIPMATQTRSTPRSGGIAVGIVAKGGTYSEDTTTNDEVILNVQKFGEAIRIAEEDINDSPRGHRGREAEGLGHLLRQGAGRRLPRRVGGEGHVDLQVRHRCTTR